MTFEEFRQFCKAKPGVTEEMPFGPDVMVYKVVGKMFALHSISAEPEQVSLKCDPDLADELRRNHQDIIPGYHLNKRHWNTIVKRGNLPIELMHMMTDHSYDLVVKKLKKIDRDKLRLAKQSQD